jgi:hypothetical protein
MMWIEPVVHSLVAGLAPIAKEHVTRWLEIARQAEQG